MMWIVLIGSGVLEAVWATALGRSEGLSKPGPTALFLVALIASMIGLAVALREIPVGTGYALWVGVGAALTATYAMISGDEPVSALRIALLAGIVACVAGLKLSH